MYIYQWLWNKIPLYFVFTFCDILLKLTARWTCIYVFWDRLIVITNIGVYFIVLLILSMDNTWTENCKTLVFGGNLNLSRGMRFPTMWYIRPAKPQISLRICAVWSDPLLVARIFYDCCATDWGLFGFSKLNTWVKVFRTNPEFRILRLTFHRKSA